MTPADRSELEGFLRGRAQKLGRMGSLGDARSDLNAMPLPGALARYLTTGAPMPTWKRDLGAMSAQVPRLVYGALAAASLFFASRAYRRWRDAK